jgi:hypothetical protein
VHVRIYKSIQFEFDDPHLIDLQDSGSSFSRDVAQKPGGVDFWSTSLTHRHERGLVIPQFGYTWAGEALVLADEYVIERAVVHLLGWVNEQTNRASPFNRVELTTAELGTRAEPVPTKKDVTTEAKVVSARLAVLRSVKPTDFS